MLASPLDTRGKAKKFVFGNSDNGNHGDNFRFPFRQGARLVHQECVHLLHHFKRFRILDQNTP
jgi:hypothetical protein